MDAIEKGFDPNTTCIEAKLCSSGGAYNLCNVDVIHISLYRL